jgi:uncharacterized protein
MSTMQSRPQELVLPVASFAALRAALVDALGADAAADALRRSGFAAGDALFSLLTGTHADAAGIGADRFWAELSGLFATRGWGQVSFSRVHEGVAALDSADWVEARLSGDAQQPSCHFSTGMLANVLGQAAGAEIAVLEVQCRSRGDDHCRFLFGGRTALYRVYEDIVGGVTAEGAIAQLR